VEVHLFLFRVFLFRVSCVEAQRKYRVFDVGFHAVKVYFFFSLARPFPSPPLLRESDPFFLLAVVSFFRVCCLGFTYSYIAFCLPLTDLCWRRHRDGTCSFFIIIYSLCHYWFGCCSCPFVVVYSALTKNPPWFSFFFLSGLFFPFFFCWALLILLFASSTPAVVTSSADQPQDSFVFF
jgi:hypothetical protein